jgi:hypothetical protein
VGHATGLRGTASNGPSAHLSKAVGIEAAVNNATGATITEASAFEVAPPANTGIINKLYGFRIPDIDQGAVNYAIYAGKGTAHLGDIMEMPILSSAPTATPPTPFVLFYPKLVSGTPNLFVKDSSGVEHNLTTFNVDTTVVAGEALSDRDFVYVNPIDNLAYKLDVTATNPVKVGPMRGVALSSIAVGASGAIRLAGQVDGFTGLSVGVEVWVGSTPGSYIQTKPAAALEGSQVIMIRMGVAGSSTSIILYPTPIQYLKQASLAANGVLTIEHAADVPEYTRNVNVIANNLLASYDSPNQDSDVSLRQPLNGGVTTIAAGSGTPYPIGSNAGTPNWEAQAFQVPAGKVSQITINLAANTGSPTSTITWEIHADASGVPASTSLQSGTFTPTANATNTITVSSGIFLSANTTYWLVLRPTTAQTGTNYWNWAVGAAYANGSRALSTNSGAVWTVSPGATAQCSITTAAVPNDLLAQSFQIGATNTVDQVKLFLKKVGNPTGTMTLQIQTDSAGSPSGTLANASATVTVAESSVPATHTWVPFNFATNFSLTVGTTYWLVLSTNRAASATDYIQWGADASSPAYANGQMKSQSASAWRVENKDAIFDVRSPNANDETVVIGRVSGGTRDIAIRYDDGAGLSADTKTTFKNVTAAALVVTCTVEIP